MDFLNYKKNELKKMNVEDFGTVPNLKNVNKTEVITNWIISVIKDKKWKEHLLPNKAEWSYALGVSYGTIQNVLKSLEDKNYIFLKQRIGAIVKKQNEEKNIKKQISKSDKTVEMIKEYIISSQIMQDEEIPSMRNIAKKLNISFNSVRVAINKLVANGILEIRKNKIILKNEKFNIKQLSEKTLVEGIKEDLKKYILRNYKIGEKIVSHIKLADKMDVSVKTINNAIKLLEKEGILLTRRGTYGTIVVSTSKNPKFDSRPEMSIFATASETAFYHYEKTQNKIKKMIAKDYSIGSKLPSIREWSDLMDLSPNTIRKVLNNLKKEGILRSVKGKYGGTFVIDIPDIEEQAFKWLAVNPQYAEIETQIF